MTEPTPGTSAAQEAPLSADERRARELLTRASSVLVLTGAGISAESGVPTFRGNEGLWGEFRAEDLATPEAFERDPRLVWEWYGWRREQLAACEPNAAHLALARWQRSCARVRIATQNVDGLHSLAARAIGEAGASRTPPDGPDPVEDLVEVHGALFRSRCTGCGSRFTDRAAVDATSLDTLPRCDSCGELLRPDVVWFGEPLETQVIELAFEWAMSADVCLVVGTSALVHPAASLPTVSRQHGGRIIEVNPEGTPLTAACTVSLRGTAAGTVPRVVPWEQSATR